ncbi:MAG TPA: 3-dehydroquinate synthase [Chloroflexota bacterium]|nr:3-dehydroquinate synthase [Chloroflexota bacterium]
MNEATPRMVLRYDGQAHSIVHCGAGALDDLGNLLGGLARPPRRAILCSDSNVSVLHGERASRALVSAGIQVEQVMIAAGEEHKNLETVARCYREFAALAVERGDVVVALGGGVLGDLFGFVAATYLRGLRLAQAPTTLVAQVDSAIGGKVGVDLPEGKNLVGAFKHPELVVADEDLLRTLPDAEWIAGTAEVAKAGVIADAQLFTWLESDPSGWRQRSIPLGPILGAAIAVKAKIVEEDVLETGSRMYLNYGHTFGHAVEAAAGYGVLRHGEAVGWGMAMEARLAAAVELSNAGFVARQDRLLRNLGLLAPLPPVKPDHALAYLYRDKKVRDGRIRWALPTTAPGACVVRDDVPSELVRAVLERTLAGDDIGG